MFSNIIFRPAEPSVVSITRFLFSSSTRRRIDTSGPRTPSIVYRQYLSRSEQSPIRMTCSSSCRNADVEGRDALEGGGGTPPPSRGRPAYAQPLSH